MKARVHRTDRPIERAVEDKLGRQIFAHRLADDIAAWSGAESLVIGLHADWGYGKSSVKNMATERLASLGDKAPRVVEFNPWMASGEAPVAQAFFQQVGEILADVGLGDNGSKRAAAWRRYARYFSAAAHTATAIDTLLPLIGVIPGFGRSMAEKLRDAAGLAESAASQVDRSDQSFEDLRDELKSHFRKLKRKLLVVVDDIDRLTDDEIRLIVRVVKASADFPNTVYLLLFQKEAVIRALNPISGGQGAEFLKKIVQIDLGLPQLPQQKVAEFWEKGVSEIFAGQLERLPAGELIDYWFSGLNGYFRNLRDVTRFLNSLGFVAGGYCKDDTWEVSVMDLIVIETLRLFEPPVYRIVAQNRRLLTSYSGRDNHERLGSLARSLVDASERAYLSEGQFVRVVGTLFPVLQSVWANTNYGGNSDHVWLREKRACTEHFFDRYFYFALPEGGVSEEIVVRTLAAKSNRDALCELIRQLQVRGNLFDALKRLEAEDALYSDPSMAYVLALSDLCDEWPEAPAGELALLSGSIFARMAVNRLLALEKDEEERREKLVRFLRATNGLLLPARLISQGAERKGGSEFPQLDVSTVSELKDAWVDRVKVRSAEERFLKITDLFVVLLFWRDWGEGSDVTKWVTGIGADREKVLRLISTMAGKGTSQTAGSYFVRRRLRLPWRQLQELGDRAFWESVDAAFGDWTPASSEGVEILHLFRGALSRWKSGLADDEVRDDDESD